MSRNKPSMKHYSYSSNRDSGYYRYRGSSMDEYLKERQLKRKAVAKDGSCLFRAVGEQAWLTQATHWKLRRHCANHIKKRKDYFKSFLTMPVEEYCHKLSSQVVWGGEIELVALSQMLERNIIVYKEEENKVTPQEFPAANSTKPPILLAYTGKNHYDIVWKEETERAHGFCQSIVYDILMDRVFGENLEKPLRERMKTLTRFALSEKYNSSCRELKQRYPPEVLHCWAGRIYENTALTIAENERQEREVSDRRMAARLQIQHMHVGHQCDVLYKGVWYEGEIARFHKPTQVADVCIYHMDNGVYPIPFKDIVLTRSSKYRNDRSEYRNDRSEYRNDRSEYRNEYRSDRGDYRNERSDSRSEMRPYDQRRARHDGRRQVRSPSPPWSPIDDELHTSQPFPEAIKDPDPYSFTSSHKAQSSRVFKPHTNERPPPSEVPMAQSTKPQPSEAAAKPQISEVTTSEASEVCKPQTDKIPKPKANEVSKPCPSEVQRSQPSEVPKSQPTEVPKSQSSEVSKSCQNEVPKVQPNKKAPKPQSSELPKPQPNSVSESQPSDVPKLQPTEVSKPQPNEPPLEKTESTEVRSSGRRKKKSRRNNEANKQATETGTTSTSTATSNADVSSPTVPPTTTAAISSMYSPAADDTYSSHMDAISEAPECEWPILHASEARYAAGPGSFIDGPPNDDDDQLPVPFIFNNPGDMLMRELDPPVHLLHDDSLDTKLHFMIEFAQKCLGIYSKYVRDPEREDLFSNLCSMKFEDFRPHPLQESTTSSYMSRAESEESVMHQDVKNSSAAAADTEDKDKAPADVEANSGDTDTDGSSQKESEKKEKALSSEEEKFLAEFQNSYGDVSPVPDSYTDAPIITEPISIDEPIGGRDLPNNDDMLPESDENYDSMQYGHNPMYQPGQMPPMMAYPQPYPVWPHPFQYGPPWGFMPMPPMMVPAIPPYYQGPHPPMEDQIKEQSSEDVEDDQQTSSDTASPSVNSQTELTESANEKEKDVSESDLDKSTSNEVTEKAMPTEKSSETPNMEDKTQGRMQLGTKKFFPYNYPQRNRGGYQRYIMGGGPRQHQQQWGYDHRGTHNKRRTREQETK